MGGREVTQASDPDRFLAVLRSVVDALEDRGRPYAVVGSVANDVYLEMPPAEDLDVLVPPDDGPGAVEALVAAGFEPGERRDWLLKAHRGGVLVDVLTRPRGGVVLDDAFAAAIRRVDHRGLQIPVPSPEDLAVIACLSAQEETPDHWFTAVRFVRDVELDPERLLDRARRLAPLRVASLLLYCRSERIAVPDGILTALLPS
jgi:Uncharacterised nucleotidyltransferase